MIRKDPAEAIVLCSVQIMNISGGSCLQYWDTEALQDIPCHGPLNSNLC